MMIPKIIKTEEDYQEALARLELLMDAAPGSPDEKELDLLSFLIEKYEEEHFPIELPNAVEAIKFRMEQQGLTRKDLVRYIGSQSKVSEVLNYKRPLSLAMIRTLHEELGIPAEVLLKEAGRPLKEREYNPDDYPINEMFKAGYFPQVDSLRKAKENAEELLEGLLEPLKNLHAEKIYCRQAAAPIRASNPKNDEAIRKVAEETGEYQIGEKEKINENALNVWQAKVIKIIEDQRTPDFAFEKITKSFIQSIIKLSVFPNGPILAQDALLASGIHFVILPRLQKTYLDGACFMAPSGKPVIGLTLRHDRLDNFWFTLAHELAHVFLHLKNHQYIFFDNTEQVEIDNCGKLEKEANDFCVEMLIPSKVLDKEKVELLNSMDKNLVIDFANRTGIHPAIVAGRIRWEKKDYTQYNDLLGNGAIHKLFSIKVF
jgi:HTH-type transcriptional regulator / antitoxin HigA